MEITKHKFKYIGISYPKKEKEKEKFGIMATKKSYKTNKVFIYLF